MTQLETGMQLAPTELKAVPTVTNRMRSNATAFLEALDPDQRQMACFDFDNEAERRDWDFIPKSGRNGLPMRLMTHHQQTLAHQLLACSVALPTYAKVLQIMSNEHILRELQGPRIGPAASEFRSPGNYFFSVFGSRTWRRPGAGAWSGTTCRSTSRWSADATSPPRHSCWGWSRPSLA